jgi:regulator of Ty1 transposition protein 109
MSAQLPPELHRLLTARLSRGSAFTFHYLASDPAKCDPIFAAPPGGTPEPTTWESQLLSVSIRHEDAVVQVFAIEVLIYATDRIITIFVSKADSTGYLHLANLPTADKSPVRTITSAFLEYLITWKRGSRQLVLSLFARAQAQYLFPGSAENSGKHVLDDRQLIRWWCRIVDDALAKVENTNSRVNGVVSSSQSAPSKETPAASKTKSYLVIPGLDAYETRTYIPRGSTRWAAAQSPLKQLAVSPDVPERCLIPRFPDDPKARFAIDLDDELPENAIQLKDGAEPPEPSKTGKWRSVSSLEQFWELMAFRQECAAGRVVGFLWAVFEPVEGAAKTDEAAAAEVARINHGARTFPVSESREPDSTLRATEPSKPVQEDQDTAGDPENPALASEDSSSTALLVPAAEEAPAPVPPLTRPPTALVVPAAKYTAITLLLDKLDYADLAIAKISTNRFLVHAGEQAALSPGTGNWGVEIKGTLKEVPADKSKVEAKPEGVPTMLVGRKRKKDKTGEDEQTKKAKVDE